MIPLEIRNKYEVVKTLQQKAATAVILVKHKQLGDVRVLKLIQRSHPDAYDFLAEANLISGIKSPHIPTIFDIGQDENCLYFVEEYISGLSLREYLMKLDTISKSRIIKISIDICKIIEILHCSLDEAILYRDMKPEHVIINDEMVYLIDFGIAIKKSQQAQKKSLGTPSWAAPEQIRGELLDERCDVYGIGKLIAEMLDSCSDSELMKLKNVVVKATCEDIERRYSSVKELRETLESLQEDKDNHSKEKHLSKKIIVVGTDEAVGCTHISIALNIFLNSIGITSVYIDCSENDSVKKISRYLKRPKIRDEVLYHKNFSGYMDYGPGIEKKNPPKVVQVLDCGTNYENIQNADKIILVMSACPWKEMTAVPKWISDSEVAIICNFANKLSSIEMAKIFKKRIYEYPLSFGKFELSKKEKNLFHTIVKRENYFEKIN